MYIKQMAIQNYRNYKELSLSFSPHINIFIGENAQGKTNILEAIYTLALAKSHRTTNDKELIAWGQEYAKIKGTVVRKYGDLPLELQFTKQGKIARVNHLVQSKRSEYMGNMNVVMFAPEDLNIVKGSPQFRRRFIDMEIGQISQTYLHELMQFTKILKQRNQFLKNSKRKQVDTVMLEVYTTQYVQSAAQIIHRRFLFLKLLQPWAQQIHADISRQTENLHLVYKTLRGVTEDATISEIEIQLQQRLAEVMAKELERGITLVGPHRDDLQLFVNEYDVQIYGSQGQQRTAALALKLAEIELIKQEIGDTPIVLLDDVLSELDDYRQSHLLHAIRGDVQTFVTTTSVDGIEHETIKQAKMFHVKQGVVQKDDSLKEE